MIASVSVKQSRRIWVNGIATLNHENTQQSAKRVCNLLGVLHICILKPLQVQGYLIMYYKRV